MHTIDSANSANSNVTGGPALSSLPIPHRAALEFLRLDDQWMQGEWQNYKDEGLVSPGSATRKFSVWDRRSGKVIGGIRWLVPWRQYVFFPFSFPLTPKMGREIFEFCEQTTTKHRQKASRNVLGRKPSGGVAQSSAPLNIKETN